MIGRIAGTIIEKQLPDILVDVNGIGYEVQVPLSTYSQLPEIGEKTVLLTHFIVREDHQALYGFYDKQERAMFRTLLKVSGVGAKLALTILSGLNAEQFAHCILQDDLSLLMQIPGIGKKTAQRLVVEMQDKVEDWQFVPVADVLTVSNKGVHAELTQAKQEAISALQALGFKALDAQKAIQKVFQAEMDTQSLIKAALQQADCT